MGETRKLIGGGRKGEGEGSKMTPGFVAGTTEWMSVALTLGERVALGDGGVASAGQEGKAGPLPGRQASGSDSCTVRWGGLEVRKSTTRTQ